jgi:hypothetical protein
MVDSDVFAPRRPSACVRGVLDRSRGDGRLITDRFPTAGLRATASRARAVLYASVLVLAGAASATAQPAPGQPPSPPAPPPPAQIEKPLDAGVRDALQQYAAALESLDADAVKKVQPSIDVEGLKRAFREMRSLEVDIDNVKLLSSDPSSARVSCRVEQKLTPKAGSRQTTSVTRVLRLRRMDAGWIIQGFER